MEEKRQVKKDNINGRCWREEGGRKRREVGR